MPKKQLNINVYDSAKKRIEYVFDNFNKIYVSFSAGKDSTTMLHLVANEAIKRNRKIGLLFIDLESQYKFTIENAKNMFELYKDIIIPFWVCLPIHLRNAVSVYDPFWKCWDIKEKIKWVREVPDNAINNINYFPFFFDGMEFEEFVPLFGEWFSGGKKTACFVGIRADESLNRFRTIASKTKTTFEGNQWTTKVTDNVYNIYPMYDWRTRDIWIYHAKNRDKPYNKLYDMMNMAGLSIHQQRICQPYGDDQRRGLWLFHLIEPETWAKVVARVNGVNGGALYIKESGNMTGYNKIELPNGHTWESFAKLLLGSMPPKTRIHFENKIILFIKWWEEKAYPNGIPDVIDQILESKRKAPSWRRICKSLLRNDYWCKGLGFSQHKSEAYEKYLRLMERRKREWNYNLFGEENETESA